MPDLLDGLNPKQRAAVTHEGGPLLVIGAAGTGKTHVVTRRLAWLVQQDTPAECILALTASSPAAAELRERLELLLDAPYEELNVFTFGTFCVKLLQDEALEAGVDPFFSPVTPADRLALLLDRIDELTLRHHEIRGNPAPLLASFVSRIDRLKEEMVSAGKLQAWAAGLPAGSDAERARACREREFAELYADHDRLLGERGVLDNGDLVLRAFRLLHEKPHVRERAARRFRHVLVDDFQAANFAQGMLLQLLTDEHGKVTIASADEAVTRAFPDAEALTLERNQRSGRRIVQAAQAVLGPQARKGGAASGGRVRFWRCRSERAQAQAVAAEAERLIAGGVAAEEICVLVGSVQAEGATVASALEERAVAFRTCGAAAYFQRAEVRDVLAWLRALADPADSGAVVSALSRPPVELRAVDVARLTQLARRRKLDMPAAVAAALEGPQLSEEGRDRARAFLRLYRSASAAFHERRPDAFVMRLIERIGLRRQQVFATHADTVERLRNIAKLPELATAYMQREPQATARDFARYLAAVAESGLREEEAVGQPATPAVSIMTMRAARGLEFEHVFVLGLSAAAMPGPFRPREAGVPDALRAERPGDEREAHEAESRRLLAQAMTRARKGLVLAWAESGAPGATPRPSPFYEEARAALDVEEELFEEELFGPAEGLHSTFRLMRDELLDTRGAPGRAARRDAPRHLPRRGPGRGALPGADQGGGVDRARQGGPDARHGAHRGQRDPGPVRHARAARHLRRVRPRRLAARLRARSRRPARRLGQRLRAVARPVHPAPRPRPDAVGLGHRHLPDLPAQVQVRARVPDPPGAHDPPALRDRAAPGARALPRRGRRAARAPDGAVRDLLAALGLRRLRRRAAVPRARARARWSATGARTATRTPSRSGSSARSRSSSAPTCCAGGWTAWTAAPTARTS